MARRGRSEAPGGDIRAYLTLMYVVERALDGFLRWAHAADEAFEPTLHAHLEQIVDRQQEKPLLVTAQQRMIAVRKILDSGKAVTDHLSDLATLAAAVNRAEKELETASRKPGAVRGAPAPSDDAPDYHLSLAVPVRYFEERIKKAKRGEGGARLLSNDDLRRAQALLSPIHRERNRIMHGHIPSFHLDGSGDGLIDQASELFELIWKWVHSTGQRYRKEPFSGFRYLALDTAMLRRIATNGRIASHTIVIDGRELIFYESGNALAGPRPRAGEVVWISEQPRPRKRSRFETLQKAEERARDSWLKGVATVSADDSPALPEGASDDLFAVPFWRPVHPDDPQHIALIASPRLRNLDAPHRSAPSPRR